MDAGTVPGTALAFSASKDALENPRVLLYPSKSEGMFVEDGSLIFRSVPSRASASARLAIAREPIARARGLAAYAWLPSSAASSTHLCRCALARIGLGKRASAMWCRSDSNGEDLEGYAGAGLYESVTTAETRRMLVDYSADPLL